LVIKIDLWTFLRHLKICKKNWFFKNLFVIGSKSFSILKF
jgi:hypothetical protein